MNLQNTLTSFLDLLPAELIPPDHWEDRIEATLCDQLQGFLQMVRVETRWSSLNITHHIHLCQTKQDVCANQLLLLASTFIDSAVQLCLSLLHPGVVGEPGCSLTNSWMVSKDVDESWETSGLLWCTLAPQAIATSAISLWSVDTHTLGKQKVYWCHSYTHNHTQASNTWIHNNRLPDDQSHESETSPTFNELLYGPLSTSPQTPLTRTFFSHFFLETDGNSHITSMAGVIHAFKHAVRYSPGASVAFVSAVWTKRVVTQVHADRVAQYLTVPVKQFRVHCSPQHPSDERNSGQHFDVFQRDPFTPSPRQNQGSDVTTDIRPGQLADVSVIVQEASFSGSHGRARKLAANRDDGARQGEIAVRMCLEVGGSLSTNWQSDVNYVHIVYVFLQLCCGKGGCSFGDAAHYRHTLLRSVTLATPRSDLQHKIVF